MINKIVQSMAEAMAGIEDGEYKNDKIECTYPSLPITNPTAH